MPPKPVCPCLECKKAVTKKTGGIKCNYCERWVHAKCGNISQGHLKLLSELPGAQWNCNPCSVVSKKVAQEIKNLNLKSNQMRLDLDKNIEDMSIQKTWNTNMEKKVEELSRDSTNNEAVFEELRERQKRSKNLVVHQISEPPPSMSRGVDRMNHDMTKIIEVFEHLRCPTRKEDIKFLYRPGERTEGGRPRPIILSLKDLGAREYILSNSRMLSGTDFNHVSIVPDLTHQQRKEEEKLRKTAEKRNSEMTQDEALNWEWVLVGVRGERELIKRRVHITGGRGSRLSQPVNRQTERMEYIDQDAGSIPLTGANMCQIIAPRVPQPQGSVLNRPTSPTSLRGRGRGGGRGRGSTSRGCTAQATNNVLTNSARTASQIVPGNFIEEEEGELVEENDNMSILVDLMEPEVEKGDELPSEDEEEDNMVRKEDQQRDEEEEMSETTTNKMNKKRQRQEQSTSPAQRKKNQME